MQAGEKRASTRIHSPGATPAPDSRWRRRYPLLSTLSPLSVSKRISEESPVAQRVTHDNQACILKYCIRCAWLPFYVAPHPQLSDLWPLGWVKRLQIGRGAHPIKPFSLQAWLRQNRTKGEHDKVGQELGMRERESEKLRCRKPS